MKHLLICIISLLFIAPAASSQARHIINVDAFDELYAKGSCAIELRYNPDSVGMVLINTTPEIYNGLEKALVQRSLYISMPQGVQSGATRITLYCNTNLQTISVSERCKLSIPKAINFSYDLSLLSTSFATITAADIRSSALRVSATGGAHVTVNNATVSSTLSISAVGSSRVSFAKVSANDLNATLRGSGSVDVVGSVANRPSLVVKGTGTIDVAGVRAPRIQAAVYGEGSIMVPKSVTVEAQGKSDHIFVPSSKTPTK